MSGEKSVHVGPQAGPQKDLSIVIVNWNSVAHLRKCLQSIYANTAGIDFEVLVVDNASFDGSAEVVQQEYPQARFIQSRENLGFARANNLACEFSQGRNLLFLNPDTEIMGRAINVMLSSLESTPDAGLVGCTLLNSDLSVQTSCVQAYPTILGQVLDAALLRRIFPRWRLWGMRALFNGNEKPVEVEVISGACLMVRREVFEKVGGFTTDYFMYAEDTDLCFKVKSANWKNYYVGAPTVVHHGSGSSDSHPENHSASVLMRESIFRFLQLRHSKIYATTYRIAIAWVALLRLGALAGLLVLPAAAVRRSSLRASFVKWRRLLRWAVGMETWAKQPTKPQA